MITNTTCRCGLPPTTDGSCSTLPPTRRTEARWDGSCCLLPRSARYLLPHHCCLKMFNCSPQKSKCSPRNSQCSCLQVHHCGKVFVGLVNGQVQIFRRDHTVNWDLNSPATLTIGTDPVCCLLPTSGALYTASGQKILMVDAWANAVIRSFMANGEQVGGETPSPSVLEGSVMSLNSQAASTAASMANLGSMVSHMAVCGIGLWVALHHSSTVSLYHTESFIHMQDINIASNVSRALGGSSKRSIYVTALSAAKGLLWVSGRKFSSTSDLIHQVGTNVGIALTIPLPRLEGVPIISGKANISYHAHFGPVRMFLPLQPKV